MPDYAPDDPRTLELLLTLHETADELQDLEMEVCSRITEAMLSLKRLELLVLSGAEAPAGRFVTITPCRCRQCADWRYFAAVEAWELAGKIGPRPEHEEPEGDESQFANFGYGHCTPANA